MVEQLIPIEAPREIAGRELKRRYSQELGLKPGGDRGHLHHALPGQDDLHPPAGRGGEELSRRRGGHHPRSTTTSCTRLRNAGKPEGNAAKKFSFAGELLPLGSPGGRIPQPLPRALPAAHRPDGHHQGLQRHREGQAPEHRVPGMPCLPGRLRRREPDRREPLRRPEQEPSSDRQQAQVRRRSSRRKSGGASPIEDFSLRGLPQAPAASRAKSVDLRERVMRRKRADESLQGPAAAELRPVRRPDLQEPRRGRRRRPGRDRRLRLSFRRTGSSSSGPCTSDTER